MVQLLARTMRWATQLSDKIMKLYRFLSEDDTSAFCHKVTAALNKGWELQGSPTYAFDAAKGVMRCGQAVVKEVPGTYAPDVKLSEQ